MIETNTAPGAPRGAKVPATVVTGFLGAGKTTLIRNLLANAGGRRIALIVNEFGDVGVDGEILKGCGDAACAEDDIIELSNGCLCCTVADDFIPTMSALLDRADPPEHIVIETSGLALPQPLVRAFAWPEIRTRVTVDGVVTVVDGAAVAEGRVAADEGALARQRAEDDTITHETPLQELFEDQLACADMIVVSKADLLGAEAAGALAGRLRDGARPGVRAVPSAMGAVDPAVLLGLGIGAEADLDARREIHHAHDHHDDHHDDEHHDHDHDHHHHDHGHDAFHSIVASAGAVRDARDIVDAVAAAIEAHGLLRVKGFVAVDGKPMRLALQAVGPRIETYFDRPWRSDEPRETRLVAIGEAGLDWPAVEAALARL